MDSKKNTDTLAQVETETVLNDNKLVKLDELVMDLAGVVSCKEWQE